MRNFLTKIKFDFFFDFFFKRCLYHSSKGTKNNEENILSSFREIEKSLKKLSRKWSMILAQYFEKRICRFFSPNVPKNVQKHIFYTLGRSWIKTLDHFLIHELFGSNFEFFDPGSNFFLRFLDPDEKKFIFDPDQIK